MKKEFKRQVQPQAQDPILTALLLAFTWPLAPAWAFKYFLRTKRASKMSKQ